jgi:hypothetical protein
MTNIHTPEGFKEAFLLNQKAGSADELVVSDTPEEESYPTVDFLEFLTHDAQKFVVKHVELLDKDKRVTEVAFLYHTSPEHQNEINITSEQVMSIDAAKALELKNTHGVVTITNALLNDKNYLKALNEQGDRIMAAIKHASQNKNDVIHLTKLLSTHKLTKIDPYIATRILLGYQYPKVASSGQVAHYFAGGNDKSNIKEFVTHIFVKALMQHDQTSNTLLGVDRPESPRQYFIDNIVEFVFKSNEYAGAIHFDSDVHRHIGTTHYAPAFGGYQNAGDIDKQLSNIKDSIFQTAADAKIYYNTFSTPMFGGVDTLAPMLGGGDLTFNKSYLYKKYFELLVRKLKSINKTFSQNSHRKIDTLIEEIAEREGLLKTIMDSLNTILMNNNYKPEVINDLDAYKNLYEKKFHMQKAISKAYINIADVVKTLEPYHKLVLETPVPEGVKIHDLISGP